MSKKKENKSCLQEKEEEFIKGMDNSHLSYFDSVRKEMSSEKRLTFDVGETWISDTGMNWKRVDRRASISRITSLDRETFLDYLVGILVNNKSCLPVDFIIEYLEMTPIEHQTFIEELWVESHYDPKFLPDVKERCDSQKEIIDMDSSEGLNREQYLKFHKDMCDKLVEVTTRKNNDYAGDRGTFANFESVEAYGIPTEIGFITRMNDKLSRIATFVDKGVLEVKDESIEDTLMDLANYSILFAGYIRHKKMKANGN